MTLHFLNGIVNDLESDKKIDNYIIIASLKSGPYASFDIKFTRLHFKNAFESDSTNILKALPCKLDIKRHSAKLDFLCFSP